MMDRPEHRGIFRLVSDLNGLYRSETSLHRDFDPHCFPVDRLFSDVEQSVFVMMRPLGKRPVVAVINATPRAQIWI